MRDQGDSASEFRSVCDLGEQFRRVAAEGPASVGPSHPVRRVAAIVASGVAILAIVSVTPPGRAAADALGNLVGIGDEPSDPILFNVGGPSVVVGVGESPNGQPVELVASPAPASDGVVRSACVYPSFPETKVHAVGVSCNEVGRNGELSVFPYRGPPELGGNGLLVTAKSFADASAIEVVYLEPDGTEVVAPQISGFIDEELGASVGAGTEFHYAVAFLPTDLVTPTVLGEGSSPEHALDAARRATEEITVRALGPDGEILSSFNLGKDSPSWLPGTLVPGEGVAVYLGDPEGEDVTPIVKEIGTR